jgi:RNA polymerase sigma-70 factor (ECF subfamily)
MAYRLTAYRNLNDEELLELLKSSDKTAYEELYNRYWAIVFRHARGMLLNDEEAKDLVQDLFVVLWNKAADLAIESSFSSYLYGMVRYKVFDLIDKRKVQKRHLQSLENFIHNGECTTDHTVRENELSRIIELEVSMLPARMREVFELSRKSHFSYQQISTHMDISDQTVKKQIYNALKILRFKLGGICLFIIFCI